MLKDKAAAQYQIYSQRSQPDIKQEHTLKCGNTSVGNIKLSTDTTIENIHSYGDASDKIVSKNSRSLATWSSVQLENLW